MGAGTGATGHLGGASGNEEGLGHKVARKAGEVRRCSQLAAPDHC